MINNKKENARILINISSTLVYTVLYILIIFYFYDKNIEYDYGIRGYLVVSAIYLSLISIFLKSFDAFKLGNKRISDIALSSILSIFLVDLIMYFVFGLIEGHLVLVYPYLLLFVMQTIFAIIYSYFGNKIIRYGFPAKKTIIIYKGKDYKQVVEKIKKYQYYEFDIKKILNENKLASNLKNILQEYETIITINISQDIKHKLVKYGYENNIYIYDVPNMLDIVTKSSSVTNFIDTPLFKLNKFGPNVFEQVVKRGADIIGSTVALILLFPIMLITAAIIKVQDGGCVFFKQKRLTINEKEFYLIKFRSMIMNAEPEGKAIRAKNNDPRITKFGSFIRATRIDELPQLFNILKGDLSLVGPRALRVEEYEENRKKFPEFYYRLKVKAGLTGYAQVYGKYNTTFKDKLLLDMFYIENYSIILDIKLLFMTIVTVFKKESTEGF